MKKFLSSLLIFMMMTMPCFAIEVPHGKAVQVQSSQKVDADIHKEGSTVKFQIAHPVIINNKVVFTRGTEVIGTVVHRKNNGIIGIPGSIEVGNFYINNNNGEQTYLTGTIKNEGDNRYWANIGWFFLFPILFIKGDDGFIKTNNIYTLYIE